MSSGGTKAFFCFTFYITTQHLCSSLDQTLQTHFSNCPKHGWKTHQPALHFDFKWRKCKISCICTPREKARHHHTPLTHCDSGWVCMATNAPGQLYRCLGWHITRTVSAISSYGRKYVWGTEAHQEKQEDGCRIQKESLNHTAMSCKH